MHPILKFMTLILVILLTVAPLQAATSEVYPQGNVEFTVPASQYLNVFTAGGGGGCRVLKQVGGPSTSNVPRFTLETNGAVQGNEVVFGPYTVATTIRIEAQADPVFYSVGALAASLPVLQPEPLRARTQLAPATYNTTATLLASDIMIGLLTGAHATGATAVLTLPTGTLMDAATGIGINQGFEWTYINTSAAAADTATITAGSGHTIVGVAIVQSAHSTTGGIYGNAARFLSVKTAANTFVTYRIQ